MRKSLKRNKIRRRSQFKPGHPCLYLWESVGMTFSESKDTSETATPLTSNKIQKLSSFKSNENIHEREDGSYYVVSANKASSVTL